ncbi:MAG: DegT/DnrJ/EryC1/StrS aminotransferase family protein [Nitrospiraceae bacterium]|nr:DegT/DnrJ/EryC1/StrS aminotransferase family protein [Nitrospiraceae bacterium]
MSIFREIPPTAGFRLSRGDVASMFSGSGAQSLRDDFRQYLGIDYVRVTYSGTAAFYLLLESLKKVSSKKTVIIPSCICPLIPLAISRAGLRVEVCDISGSDFNFDPLRLEKLCRGKDVLAILAVHLAGMPVDFDAIKTIAKEYDAFTIEDCAQSLGAVYKGKKTGALGDFSFFSLCRGKGLTTYEGGIIASNRQELNAVIDTMIKDMVKPGRLSEASLIMLLMGYWIFYRPLFFWFVFRLPEIFWTWRGDEVKAAMEDFEIDFPIHKVSAVRQAIGHSQFARIEKEIESQRQKAAIYINRLKNIKGIKVIEESPDSRATYPFMTIIFETREKREKAKKAFEGSGLGVSIVYARAIADYDYLKDIVPDRNCPNGRIMSERSLTLSTSLFLETGDIETIVKKLEDICSA